MLSKQRRSGTRALVDPEFSRTLAKGSYPGVILNDGGFGTELGTHSYARAVRAAQSIR
jgi:hypothetical protein